MRTRLVALSMTLAAAAAAFLLFVPVYTGSDGSRTFHQMFLEVNGTGALLPMVAPVLIALAPLLFPGRAVTVIAAALLGGFALVAMSIGLLYLPAAVVMVLAACTDVSPAGS